MQIFHTIECGRRVALRPLLALLIDILQLSLNISEFLCGRCLNLTAQGLSRVLAEAFVSASALIITTLR